MPSRHCVRSAGADAETRPVALYQAQTVARPLHPRIALALCEPATRAYPAGMLEALRASGQPGTERVRRVQSAAIVRAGSVLLLAATLAGAALVAWLPRTAPGARASISSAGSDKHGRARAAQPSELPPARSLPPPAASTTIEPMPAVGPPPAPRAAAEWLAQADYDRALAAYRRLSSASPNQRAYALIAAVIERKLSERCAQRESTGVAACARKR